LLADDDIILFNFSGCIKNQVRRLRMIKFIMITNNPDLARLAESSGVKRIFVDLERLGKKARQGHLDTYISNHSIEDVAKVKHALDSAELLVRLNPLNRDTDRDVEQAIINGADILMLPMFRTSDEVQEFVRIVDRRVKIIPLVETFDAVQSIDEIVNIRGGVRNLYRIKRFTPGYENGFYI